MTELLRTPYMSVSVAKLTLTLSWQREEPDDSHSVATASQVKQVLDDYLVAHKDSRYCLLVDLAVVQRTFLRGTAAYAGWLVGHRSQIRSGAFVSNSIIVRVAAATAALFVPGVTIRGFAHLDEALRFAHSLEADQPTP